MPIRHLASTVMVTMTLLLLASNAAIAAQTASSETESLLRPTSTSTNEVQAAINTGSKSKVEALLKQAAATHNTDLESALLERAESKNEIKLDNGKQVTPPKTATVASTAAGCERYPFSYRHVIAIAGVNLAWEEVLVGGFCWNGNVITWSGSVSSKRWSAAPYCWKDVNTGQYWAYYPKWMKAYTDGTVGGDAIWGCISLQHDEAWIDYANGGGVFRH